MFKKLLTNLPSNPSLRADILFYSGRLRQESSVRLMGFGFLLLAALVQVSAAAYHPGRTLAAPPSLDGLTPGVNARCSATANFLPGSTTNFSVTTSVYNTPGTPVNYQYDVDANGTIDVTDNSTQNPHTHNFMGLSTGTHTIIVYVPLLSPPPYPGVFHYTTCQTQITINGQAHVVMSKSVTNTTQGGVDATTKSANAGDVLAFKLKTQNVTASDYQNYSGRDDFSSVLQYADVVDSTELSKQGIVLDNNHFLNWTTLNLKANTTETKIVTVKVKNPLPAQTATNCMVTNTYGNQVTVKLNCPVTTTTPPTPPPAATTSLPNTGPGTTVAIAFVVATAAGYFLSRSRLMAHELEIAVEDSHGEAT